MIERPIEKRLIKKSLDSVGMGWGL
jgi:hypothetical protein